MGDGRKTRRVKLRVVGTAAERKRVVGEVFAKKMLALIGALKAADRMANGSGRHTYHIEDLQMASAGVTLAETLTSRGPPPTSGMDLFGEAVAAVDLGRIGVARSLLPCVVPLVRFAKGVSDTFDRMELTIDDQPTITVTSAFLENARRAIAPDPETALPTFFQGEAIGSFDGKILEVDLRAETPKVILRLTAGGAEIDCLCPDLSADDIRPVLDRRVTAVGRAHYDGKSQLPQLLTLTAVPETVEKKGDFLRWQGTFEPFTPEPWSDDQ